MQQSRHILLDGAQNFRDIGGLAGENGKIINQGLIFRSDELSKLTEKDHAVFEKLRIKTVCDLRTLNERKALLDKLPPNCGINFVNIPLSDQNRNVNYFQFFFHLTFHGKGINFEQFIKDHYFSNAFNRTEQIKSIFQLVANRKNLPAVIHCTVGKDRTGLLSALIQLLCGVAYKDVMDDYLLTNEYTKVRIEKMIKFIRRMSFFQISAKRLEPLLQARYEYLDDILTKILNKYGSVQAYLTEACNISDETLAELKSILLT